MIYPRIFCRGENRLDTPGAASNDGKCAACELDALRLCDEKAFAHALLLALSAVDLTESVSRLPRFIAHSTVFAAVSSVFSPYKNSFYKAVTILFCTHSKTFNFTVYSF